MVRSLLLTLAFMVSAFAAFSQSNTALEGTVTDDKGETLIGATIKVLKGTDFVKGGLTDLNGHYRILLQPGSYDVEVSYTGFAQSRTLGVRALVGQINFHDVVLSSNTIIDEVVISDYKVKLIDQDKTSTGATLTSETIKNLPTRSVAAIVGTTAGVTTSENGEINIKGARSNGTAFYIDGIRVQGNLPPVQDIEQLQVITGGLSAEFGDQTGGATIIITKGAASSFHGSAEVENSYGLDPYGWLLGTANLSGPIWKKRGKDGNPDRTIFGFRVSGQYLNELDDDPPAIPVYRAKPELLRRIEENPVTELRRDFFIATGENLTNDSIEVLDYRPDELRKTLDLTTRLDFQPTQNIYFSLTGTYRDRSDKFTPGGWRLLNSQNNPTQNSSRWRTLARLRHTLGTTEGGNRGQGVSISNASYEIQFGFERSNSDVASPLHGQRYFDYGHVGRFYYDYNPVTDTVNSLGSPDFRVVHADYREQFAGFEAGYVDANGQTVIVNPGFLKYNKFAETDATSPGAIETYIVQNGRFNTIYNSLWGGMHSNINVGYNSVQKNETDIITAQASASFDVNLGKTGTHSIQFGILNEQRTVRGWSLSPFSLWQVANLNANVHIVGVDSSQVIGRYWDEFWSPFIGDSIDQYAARFDTLPSNRFYRRVREDLGKSLNEYVNVLELTPDQLSLSQFSPRELLDQNVIYYYGYDYLGNKTSENISFNDFFTSRASDGIRDFPVAPIRPLYQAAYFKDKFTFNRMIFSLGVRVEYFDLNTRVLRDPYSLYQIISANDFHNIYTKQDRPGTIGDDYKVYVASESDPTVVAYRNNDTWYSADGTQVSDANVIFQGGVIRPFYADTERGDNIFDENFDPNTSFEDYKPQINWLPRLGFSFPISDEANFFAHYDILVQRPSSNWEVTPIDYLYFYSAGRNTGIFNNANLRPERVVDYEVGFQQLLTRNSSLKLSAYYREYRDMIQQRTYLYIPSIQQYNTYGNIDFATVKGFGVQYELRRIQNAELRLSYTLQFAEGTGSEANSSRGLSGRGFLRTLYPLDFDERHNIQAIFDYRFDRGDRYNGPRIGSADILSEFGANMIISAVSGRPYTATINPARFGGEGNAGTINGDRLPWRFNIDMRLDKNFNLSGAGKKALFLNVYFRVTNLLDTRNVLGVYTATGSPTDDGYLASQQGLNEIAQVLSQQRPLQPFLDAYSWNLNNPNVYSQPRRLYLGANFNF